MAKVDVNVTCSKEVYEFGVGVAKFAGALKAAVADGFKMGDDLPAILSSAMADLIPALAGIEQAKAELNEDKASFVNSCVIAGSAILTAVTK